MESEIELDEAIKELQALAAAPELYEDFVKLGAVLSLLALLQHENTDIAVDTVDLFHELTEPDTFSENPDAIVIVSALVSLT
jgi:beta-catenin-like protein 1